MPKAKINDILIDKIDSAVAYNSSDEVLYVLTQLSEASIEVTSESKEVRDKDGTLVKKFYTGKAGTFTATNALLNTSVIGAGMGGERQEASTSKTMIAPYVRTVNAADTTTLKIPGVEETTIKVVGMTASGSMTTQYTKDTAASATAFAVADDTISLPKDPNVASYDVICERSCKAGSKLTNRADEFPSTVHLVVKILGADPCTPDVVQVMYIDIPSFQVSPDQSFTLTSDSTIDYSGDMQVAYCNSEGKILYSLVVPQDEDDTE